MIQIDMEMPKSCGGCKMSATDVCLKWLGLKRYELGSKRAIDCPLKEVPTGKWITTKQLEDMYKKYERKLWNEREDVRGDDMVEIGFAEQFLQDGLMELGCWDNDVVEEQQGEDTDAKESN